MYTPSGHRNGSQSERLLPVGHSADYMATPATSLQSSGRSLEGQPDWNPRPPVRTSLRDLLQVLFKHVFMITTVILLTVMSTCIWIWLRSDVYETSAKVLIKFGGEIADPKASFSPLTPHVLTANTPDINTEAELIKSYALADEVVTELNLDQPSNPSAPSGILPRIRFELKKLYRRVGEIAEEGEIIVGFKERLTPKEKAIVALIEGLKVESVKESSIVNVTLRTPFRAGAGRILNTLLDRYRQHRLAVGQDVAGAHFFETQADAYGNDLREKEQKLNELKMSFAIASLPEQLSITAKNISDTERATRESLNLLAATEAKVVTLKSQLRTLNPTTTVSEVSSRNLELNYLNEKKATLEMERQKLLGKFAPNTVPVQDIDQQIAGVNELIRHVDSQVLESKTVSPNSTYVDLQKELLEASQQLDAIGARYRSEIEALAAYRAQLRSLTKAEIAYNEMSREISADEDTYRLHKKNALEERSAEALRAGGISSIEIVDAAEDPILPSGIRKTYLVLGSLLVGVILSLGLTSVSEGLDHSVSLPEQVEVWLKCPVWDYIGFDQDWRNNEFMPLMPIERFLGLASTLEGAVSNKKAKRLAFVAASPGAGTTTVVAGVARALSLTFKEKTLVVEVKSEDSDTRGSLSSAIRMSPPVAVSGNGIADIRVVNANLDLMKVTAKSDDLSPDRICRISHLFEEVFCSASLYENLLIDLPSSLPSYVRLAVAKECAGVVLIVEAGRTRYEVLERLRTEYAREDMVILGAVLNKRRFHIPNSIYKLV